MKISSHHITFLKKLRYIISMYNYFIYFFFVVCFSTLFSQQQTTRSRSEIGITTGGMYYIGDLNPTNHFANTTWMIGGVYRYFINPRLVYRAQFSYGNLNAADADAHSNFQRNRNLSFQTDIYELASGIEINYLKYQTGHQQFKISPYFYVELGLFRMNPKTDFNGNLVELQSLGTEGQGTELSDKELYKKIQFCLPIGLGLKVSLSKMISFSLEYGLRKTFTDYIDDVSSFTYVDRVELATYSSPIVSELSNRSIDDNPYGRRGNPTTKDWYFMANAMLMIKLGNPSKCYNH